MSSKLKRLLAVALAVVMSFGMISTGVAAAEETTEPPSLTRRIGLRRRRQTPARC